MTINEYQKLALTTLNPALSEKDVLINGSALKDMTLGGEGKIDYNAITLAINETSRGQAQTIWYAKTTDVNNNVYRNMMLKMKEPLMYNLGTLTYTLNSANFL